MAWQDDLRELDSALAEGRISADDYRRRRDEVLAASSGAVPPPQPGGQQGPFAPPFRWETNRPQPTAESPDKTQVVSAHPPQNPDATQVVTSQGGDSERTQFVRPVTPAGGWPAPAQPGPPVPMPGPPGQPGQQVGSGMPPWGGDNFFQEQPPGWIAQGPEVFDDKPSSTGKRILVIVLVLVVLGGIGAGVWFFTKSGGDTPSDPVGQSTAQQTAETSTTTSKPAPTDPLEILLEQIPEPGGRGDLKIEVATTERLVELGALTQGEADLLAGVNVSNVPFKAGKKEADEFGPTPDSFSIMVIPTAGEADAAALVDRLKVFQEANGLVHVKEPLPNMPPSLVFEKSVANEAAVYRGLWVSGKNVVRVNVEQVPMTGEAGLSGSYQRQTQSVLKVFPATP
ncbi:hypothetical protein ACFYOT_04740 [Saccharothrix saharensis]|uniref:hypothetical protein n=1 Tax=Saccharothrix saharensis TaxID=571190 RepID=UPI00369C144D